MTFQAIAQGLKVGAEACLGCVVGRVHAPASFPSHTGNSNDGAPSLRQKQPRNFRAPGHAPQQIHLHHCAIQIRVVLLGSHHGHHPRHIAESVETAQVPYDSFQESGHLPRIEHIMPVDLYGLRGSVRREFGQTIFAPGKSRHLTTLRRQLSHQRRADATRCPHYEYPFGNRAGGR